jgi:hypothetical protein
MLEKKHYRLLEIFANEGGIMIVPRADLELRMVIDLLQLKMLQVFESGRYAEDPVELCLTVAGWNVARRFIRTPKGEDDGDGVV